MKGTEWDKPIHALVVVVGGGGCLIIRNKIRKTFNIHVVKGRGSERTLFEILSLLSI